MYIYILKSLSKFLFCVQKLIKIDRIDNKLEYAAGSQWFSITNDFAKYTIENKEWIKKQFRYGICVDEIFLQTLIVNSKFKDNVFDSKFGISNNLREIDWNRGNLYVWRISDNNYLLDSDNLFARKFDERIDYEIINKIYNFILNKEENRVE